MLGHGLLGELDISLCDEVAVGLITCGGVLIVRVTQLLSGSARGLSTTSRKRKVKGRRKCWKLKVRREGK